MMFFSSRPSLLRNKSWRVDSKSWDSALQTRQTARKYKVSWNTWSFQETIEEVSVLSRNMQPRDENGCFPVQIPRSTKKLDKWTTVSETWVPDELNKLLGGWRQDTSKSTHLHDHSLTWSQPQHKTVFVSFSYHYYGPVDEIYLYLALPS